MHDTTGYSPFELMFGRKPCIALDVVLGLINEDHEEREYGDFVTAMTEHLHEAYEKVAQISKVSQDHQKKYFDLKAHAAMLDRGDRVLVNIVAYKGKHKIADRWEEEPSIIIRKPNADMLVYVVQKDRARKDTAPKSFATHRTCPRGRNFQAYSLLSAGNRVF